METASSTTLRDAPLAVPVPHLAAKSALSEGYDDESALAEGGVGLGVAVPAERDQPVEIEVRALLGALGDVMRLEASPDAARLPDAAGTGQDLGEDLVPFLETLARRLQAGRVTRRRGAPGGDVVPAGDENDSQSPSVLPPL